MTAPVGTEKSMDTELAERYLELLRPVYSGRKFIHVEAVDASLHRSVWFLENMGAARPLLIAGNRGTSDVPMDESFELYYLDVQGNDIVESSRVLQSALANPPTEIKKAIERWDPDGSAQWVCTAALNEFGSFCGRRKYGHRKPAWTDLENKTTIDDIWDSLGIVRSESSVIRLSDPNLLSHVRSLNQENGTVWAADNRDGVHGGGIGLRWVRSTADVEHTIEEMSDFADAVRIMPFLDGIPMSIHGIVFPDWVLVLRPVELIVLRRLNSNRLLWGGCSTGYDPANQDRAEMRAIARQVGEGLRESVDYRGPFSIDGILTSKGFRPTELNPRLSVGFGPQLQGIEKFPIAPLCWALMEGEDLDYQPELLEESLLDVADAHRVLKGHVISPQRVETRTEVSLIRDGEEFRECLSEESPDATLVRGPSPVGSIWILKVHTRTDSHRGLVAPEMVKALRFADENLGGDFGPVSCAKEARI